ncbi:04eb4763-fb1e-47c9-a447-4decbfaf29b3 [Sclerotinia trifoliorum]|uniref:04eb4763-fb1e-47c9-a447-4decbfaf29b3 n=1 Tax=Sclerotinia trifoliorum TaxID=28548 RepID=A0A8H2W4R5_9HELO|nr:04eb4763-fb1e-47c9-a447-4decbfaf29b3 [Sclerotinia trifoliorum]
MSPNSKTSRHQSRSTEGNPEDMIEQIKSIITLLDEVVSLRPHECETYIPSARSAVTALEHIRFFRDPARFAEQVWIIRGLQSFAFYDADNGSVIDIADFCQNAWLRVLRNYPENVDVLTGLGRNWLQRSQATLASIHWEEGNDTTEPQNDPRRQGPLYVEARGYLQPAVDFFTRAIRAADGLGSTSGDLLASAAESHMSLGNVSAAPADERAFTQAIRYLRRAETTQGYQLSIYLQQYLNDYGRYVS